MTCKDDDMIKTWRDSAGNISGETLDGCIPGPHFYYIYDVDTARYEWVSASAANIIGYPVGEPGQIRAGIHKDDLPQVDAIEEWLGMLSKEKGQEWLSGFSVVYDCRYIHRSGHMIRLLQQFVPFFDSGSGHFKRRGIITDITHIKREGTVAFSLLNLHGGESYINIPIEIQASGQKPCPFSKREREIVALILAGCSAKEIADKLFISQDTVKNHKKKIFAKTGCKSSLQLYNLCISSGWKMIAD